LIPKQEFLEILRQHPEIYLSIAKVLSDELKMAEHHRRGLSGNHVRGTMALCH
jgi:CRP-like cAMP-binding protein